MTTKRERAPLPDVIKAAVERARMLNREPPQIIGWTRTSAPDSYDLEPVYTVITRSSGPERSNEYMPHEKTVNVEIRVTLYSHEGRSLGSMILKQDKESYVEGTPDKIKPEPDPFDGRGRLW
jgi:hypothetical protein